jgi:hypothetical protein
MFVWRLSGVALLILLLSGRVSAAQNLQADQQNYCTYLVEQAKAQSDLLRTPNALAGLTQPDTGLPTQVVAGAQLSLSNLRKAGITLDAARKNCELYKASTTVQMTEQYALQAIEKDALTHRLELIGKASDSLNAMIDETTKMVAAQNMTRPMLLGLLSNRMKLESDRADTESRIAALYVPPLSDQPLKLQVAAKQASDLDEQKALALLTKQSNWDVALTVGTHQQVNPVANGPQPYGEVNLTYNLASKAIDRHLDKSVEAYGDWKKVQEGDAARGMEVLRGEIDQSLAAQQRRLQRLQQEAAEVENNRHLVNDPQTSAALDFRNQLVSTQLLLGIESGDASYRIDRLQEYVAKNF